MSESQSPAGSNSLPRGLMSKSGFPLNPNQRLPSLRSSLSKPSLLFHNNKTLNQAMSMGSPVKRTFKPTVPEIRRQNEMVSDDFPKSTKQTPNKTRNTPSRSRRTNSGKKAKKLIQLDSTVFTAVSPRLSPSSKPNASQRSSLRGHSSKTPKEIPELPLLEDEESLIIEEKICQDDFIDDSSGGDNKNELLPQGWENLSLPIKETSRIDESPHWLLNNEPGDKLILFQLPKFFETQTDAKIGKLKIYKSGRVELVENPSGLNFDVARLDREKTQAKDNDCSTNGIGDHEKSPDYCIPKISQEVVSHSGKSLICLGTLEPNPAIVVPQIPESMGYSSYHCLQRTLEVQWWIEDRMDSPKLRRFSHKFLHED